MSKPRTIFTTPTEGHRSWRLPVDEPTTDAGALEGATATAHERKTEMNGHAESANPNLTAARRLLDEIECATRGPEGDAQAKAGAATAHAMLVLADQVAAARLTMTRILVTQHKQREAAR